MGTSGELATTSKTGQVVDVTTKSDGRVIDALDPSSIVGGVLSLNLDLSKINTVVASESDLLIVTSNGSTILIENYVSALNSGLLKEIALPDGDSLDAPALLDQAVEAKDLSVVLADLETASGENGNPELLLTPEFGEFTVAEFGESRLRSFAATDLAGEEEDGEDQGPSVTAPITEDDTDDLLGDEVEESTPLPSFEAIALNAAQGDEDTAISLDLLTAFQAEGTVADITVIISGLPAGSSLSSGTVQPDGSVELTHTQLQNLTFTPPTDDTGTFSLSIEATATIDGEERTFAGSQNIVVRGTAAEATLAVTEAQGLENTAIPVDIIVSDVEVNDTAQIRITDIPAGATLSAGIVNGSDGSVTLTLAELSGLTISPAQDAFADFTLKVDVITTDLNSSDVATVTRSLDVTVTPVADGDTVVGGDGDDTLDGGDDGDQIDGGDGGDTIDSGGGDDIVDAGDGEDTVSGGDGDDVVDGGAGDDQLAGGDGNDTLIGGEGDDTLAGGENSDELDGGGGTDNIDGGTGDDTIEGGAGDDRLVGGLGSDLVRGGDGNDQLFGREDNDTLFGDDGIDFLIGDAGEDRLFGGLGNDILRGGNDNDFLFGQEGNDTLLGDFGADILDGGAGRDFLLGGAGGDTFKISVLDGNVDLIQAFNAAEGDVLDISDLVTFEDGDILSNFVRFEENGASTTVQIDTTGSGQNFADAVSIIGVTGLDPNAVVQVTSDGS